MSLMVEDALDSMEQKAIWLEDTERTTPVEDGYEISEDPTIVPNMIPLRPELICLSEEKFSGMPSPIIEVPESTSADTDTSGSSSGEEAGAAPAATSVVGAKRLSSRKSSGKFKFSEKELDSHRRRSSERRYRVPEFQDHLEHNLGENCVRRKSSGSQNRKNSKTVLEVIQDNNPGLPKSTGNSRKQSLKGAPTAENLKSLEEVFGNVAIDQAALNLSFSNHLHTSFGQASASRSSTSSRKASLAGSITSSPLSTSNKRKQSSPEILEKRVLNGLPIDPSLSLPAIEIPRPKEDLGSVVKDGSIKQFAMKVLLLD
jgi:hypothetical protein